MCSIVMPADYEMLVSHSPPLFSHSPPSAYLHRFDAFSRQLLTPYKPQNQKTSPLTSPKRPCLVIRADDSSSGNSSSSSCDEDPTSPTRLKKKVVFADDRGMSLTHVRVMTEPSNVPPEWSFRFLAQVTSGAIAEPKPKEEPWEILFPQPASDYVEFRKQLDTNKVSLENVIIREGEDNVMGTVKVSNINFEKEVIVRISADCWKSFQDIQCLYVPNTTGSSVYVMYDTFSFKLNLPPDSRTLEFCVCFKCDAKEFWDNNNGCNYKLYKKTVSSKPIPCDPKVTLTIKSSDIYHTKLDSWSEFASWNHLDNNNPYW